ncbi:hypothetical protein XELAEV_18002700mg [Xenopus laevis]|nr:hypothetical protein XELAEV_18002700mg [Xenopus laevis]
MKLCSRQPTTALCGALCWNDGLPVSGAATLLSNRLRLSLFLGWKVFPISKCRESTITIASPCAARWVCNL